MVHGGVHVLHIPYDEGIVAAHFQRQHLARLAAELAVQADARLAGTRKQHAVEVRIGAQRHARIAPAVDEVDDAIRQARLLPQLHGFDGRARRIFAGLEDDGVTGDQGWHDVAIRQVTGEIVRAEDAEDAMRAVAQHGVAVGDLALRDAGTCVVRLHRNIDLVGHGRHFRARLPQWFTHFFRDQERQRFRMLLQQFTKAHADGDALFDGRIGPRREGRARGLAGLPDFALRRFQAGPGLLAV